LTVRSAEMRKLHLGEAEIDDGQALRVLEDVCSAND
jgi:hypothetical protein